VELDKTALDITQIVADAVEQSTPLLRSRRQHLSIDVLPDSARVLGDKKRLVQVFANLVNNAAKYTQEGGHIGISADVRDGQVRVRVADDGIGMDAQLVDRVFDLFAQAAVTSDRSSGGLGLGLALVKNIVELHGGTVKCQSAGAGKGSTFTVSLPGLADAAHPDGAEDAAGQPLGMARPLRLLVVDDNVDAAEMLGMLLEAAGHEVIVVNSPLRALELAPGARPDACLLDIGLPDMDGYALAHRLRATPGLEQAILIAITGYGQDEARKKSTAAGFDHHLVKPIDTAKLLELFAHASDA
jgi:CheY-like chemotaxis protein/anti-sigma regulatory factor (Ser/Thr protein kinase)